MLGSSRDQAGGGACSSAFSALWRWWARAGSFHWVDSSHERSSHFLLLHRNEPVTVDRLADDLWGERLPETAAKTVQVYVSRLRSELGEGRIETRGHGYVLRLEAGELDLDRFEQLVERSQGEEPPQAARTLREALALFRGEPFGDLGYESWAQGEVTRLRELRLAALELRIEADLGLGRHKRLVAELEGLVAEHPLREQLRAQLMLALYRSGRQAHALEVYRQGRAALDEQLGLQPGPELRELEQQILQHDSALIAAAAPLVERARRRRGLLLVFVGAVLLLLAAASAAVVGWTGGSSRSIVALPNSVAVVDPTTNLVTAAVPVAGVPTRFAAAAGLLWVGSDDSGRVSAFDPVTRQIGKVVAAGFPTDLAIGEGAIWVVDARSGLLSRVDPTYGIEVPPIRVTASNPAYDISRESFDPVSVAVGFGSVWVTDGTHTLVRVDPRTSKVERIDLRTPLDGVTVGPDAVWVVSGASSTAIRLDRVGRVTGRIAIVSAPGFESPYPLQVRVGEGYVWVLNGNTATVTKIDPVQLTVSTTISIGIDTDPVRLAVGGGAVWVANRDGTLWRIDPRTNAPTTIPVGHSLRDVAVVGGSVWVTAGSGLSGAPGANANASRGRVQPLPTSSCSPIYYEGGGQPQYLIASDLPLQGSGTQTQQISQAIQYVLKQHRFHAGRFAVGYQSCDDSTLPQGYWSAARCAANAHAYARDRSVIGVIGPFNSGCAQIELPILNSTPGGPLATVNASNTYVGLTRSGPGTTPGEPGRYYPTGVRNYVRLVAADDLQGAADAILARRLGARRIVVLRDNTFPYSRDLAAGFESAAARLALTVVGRQTYVDGARSYKPLAAKFKRAAPDAVFLALVNSGSGTLIQDLRAGLGPGVRIITPDGFSDFNQTLTRAGAAAEGMTISVPGVPTEQMPAAGKEFMAAFGKAVGEAPGTYVAPKRKQPRCCSTRSPDPTGHAPPSPPNSSKRRCRMDFSATSRSTATATPQLTPTRSTGSCTNDPPSSP